jgi:phenylpropionate dioxygenase-like ring-hydroxylating dioxygenase large terminal subunit
MKQKSHDLAGGRVPAAPVADRRAGREVYPADQNYPRNQWYVATFSSELEDGTLLRRELLDVPVLLYRTESGVPVALYDRCPHRGLPLSMGKRLGERVRCGYHGMEYGPDGRCARIPSQLAVPAPMAVRAFPLVERWQWIWIWLGDPELANPALIPDHEWLGLTREGLTATPFFMMEIDANYQYMHDNLLDSTHVSFLHSGMLDSGDEMASAKITIEEVGQILRISYDTPGTIFTDAVAGYFRVQAGRRYDRILTNETFAPSVSIGKQTIRDSANPSAPPVELYAINALTPANRRRTYVHHVQITSYDPQWKSSDVDAVKGIVAQDKAALEAVQRDFERYGDSDEVSVKADNMGIRCRRVITRLLAEEGVRSPSHTCGSATNKSSADGGHA